MCHFAGLRRAVGGADSRQQTCRLAPANVPTRASKRADSRRRTCRLAGSPGGELVQAGAGAGGAHRGRGGVAGRVAGGGRGGPEGFEGRLLLVAGGVQRGGELGDPVAGGGVPLVRAVALAL